MKKVKKIVIIIGILIVILALVLWFFSENIALGLAVSSILGLKLYVELRCGPKKDVDKKL